MTDPAAEALAKERLVTLLARLMIKINLLDRELRNFDRIHREMKELVDHPPASDGCRRLPPHERILSAVHAPNPCRNHHLGTELLRLNVCAPHFRHAKQAALAASH
jgi:hypothetical protein